LGIFGGGAEFEETFTTNKKSAKLLALYLRPG
jgi:hypothetical protein